MSRNRIWPRALLVALVACLACVVLLPSVVGRSALPGWYTNVVQSELRKGLDLAGGVYLEYQLELDEVMEAKGQQMGGEIARRLSRRSVPAESIRVDADGAQLVISVREPYRHVIRHVGAAAKAAGYLETKSPRLLLVSVHPERGRAVFRLDEDYVARLEDETLEQARQIVSDRVDATGITGSSVRRQEDRILVELPGIGGAHAERIKANLAMAARLEFRLVLDTSEAWRRVAGLLYRLQRPQLHAAVPETVRSVFLRPLADGGWGWRAEYSALSTKSLRHETQRRTSKPAGTVDSTYLVFDAAAAPTVRRFLAEIGSSPVLSRYRLPSTQEVRFGPEEAKGKAKAKAKLRTYVLETPARVTGDHLADAEVAYDAHGRPVVAFKLDQQGEQLFRQLTGQNRGRWLAILLDGVVTSAAIIETEIGRRGQIQLGSLKSRDELRTEAKDLVGTLKSGSLPAPMELQRELLIGPRLGREAIRVGALSLALGGLLVIGFMLVYYRRSGLVAVAGLGLNALCILATLALVGARLTLPGIAGLALTAGMAVDANVIIFERIREELRRGLSPRAAIAAAYRRAWSTILDAQVTTGIAGVVLWQYGSGPVRGFAITLLIGIACSIFTGVFASRLLFDLWLRRRAPAELSI